jgi:hypothetical protein
MPTKPKMLEIQAISYAGQTVAATVGKPLKKLKTVAATEGKKEPLRPH